MIVLFVSHIDKTAALEIMQLKVNLLQMIISYVCP